MDVSQLTFWDWVLLALGGFFVLVVGAIILGRANHRRLRQKHLNDPALEDVRESLLDYVVRSSNDQGTPVALTRFWKAHRIRGPRRYFVLKPLLDTGVLYVPERQATTRQSSGSDLFSMLGDLLDVFFDWVGRSVSNGCKYAFCEPPLEVALSDRDWVRMVHQGVSSHQVIIERVNQMQYISSGGDTNAVMSGRDSSGINQQNNRFNADDQQQLLHQLQAALLTDATRLDDANAVRVRTLARELGDVLESDQPASDQQLTPILTRARSAVDFIGGMMSNTSQVLSTMKDFGLL